jgi:hypothetical protein
MFHFHIFWFHFYTGLSYGQRDLACPAMYSMPESCLGSMYAACISQRLISHWVMKQVWTDWQFQIFIQWPDTAVQPNIN